MSDYANTYGGDAKDAAEDIILGADMDTELDGIATMSGTKADKVVAGTTNGIVVQDANGNLVDSGATIAAGVVTATAVTATDGTFTGDHQVEGNFTTTLVARETETSTVVQTSEQTESEISITIPAGWNTYDAEMVGSLTVDETISISDTVVTIRVRDGSGVAGTIRGENETSMGTGAADDRASIAIYGFAEGLTATGVITWTLSSIASANAGDFNLENIAWQVRVWRVS